MWMGGTLRMKKLQGWLENVSCYMQGKALDDEREEEAAANESGPARPKDSGLMGQISLQALLDQSTAPPGFYRKDSQDTSAMQDLDRAKSTSYQVKALLLHRL